MSKSFVSGGTVLTNNEWVLKFIQCFPESIEIINECGDLHWHIFLMDHVSEINHPWIWHIIHFALCWIWIYILFTMITSLFLRAISWKRSFVILFLFNFYPNMLSSENDMAIIVFFFLFWKTLDNILSINISSHQWTKLIINRRMNN